MLLFCLSFRKKVSSEKYSISETFHEFFVVILLSVAILIHSSNFLFRCSIVSCCGCCREQLDEDAAIDDVVDIERRESECEWCERVPRRPLPNESIDPAESVCAFGRFLDAGDNKSLFSSSSFFFRSSIVFALLVPPLMGVSVVVLVVAVVVVEKGEATFSRIFLLAAALCELRLE